MSNGLIDVFIKGISGFYTQCPRCLNNILGGEDIWIPVEYDVYIPYSQGYTLHKPVCTSCHAALIKEQVLGVQK